MLSLFNAFDILTGIIALICFYHARNNGKLKLFIAAFFYTLFLEEWGASGLRLAHIITKYSYSQDYFIMLWQVPLSIPLMWASIIYSTMETSDRLNIYPITRPFFDALLVLLTDITMDPIAIRFGLWTWESNEEFFGVPFTNFLGWLFIVFSFSLTSRILAKKLNYIDLSYFSIYVLLIILFKMNILSSIEEMAVIISISVFLILKFNKLNDLKLNNHPDFVLLAVPISLQGIFMIYLLLNKESIIIFPVLLFLSIFVLALSCACYLIPSYHLILRKMDS